MSRTAQNALDAWKGFSTPGAEAKELFRPRGGLTIQAQPTKDLSIAGQWFYNWQAVRVPESGTYLTVNDALQFGGDSAIVAANPFAAAVPGAPALLRAWNVTNIPQSRYSGSLGDFGLSARWSPAWLDGTLGFYFRNTTDIASAADPDARLRAAVGATLAGGLHRDRRPGAGERRMHHQQECDERGRRAAEGQVRHLPARLRRQHPHLRPDAVEGVRRRLGRRGALLPRRTCR